MSMMLTGRKFKNCLPKNVNKSVNATKNMMVATSVTMPSGSFGSSSRLVFLWLLVV